MKQQVFIIRHGERADSGSNEDQKSIKNVDDPHLTQIGVEQAQKTGQFIYEYLLQNNLLSKKKIKVISSPFLRCVMTAQEFVRGFN